MRYDIEINITDILSETGKEKLSNMLFNSTSTLQPAYFNNASITSINPIDLSRYRFRLDEDKFLYLDPYKYISRISDSEDFQLSKVLIKHGKFIPFVKSGLAYFFNYSVPFARDLVRKNIEYDEDFGYKIRLPEDVDYSSIRVTTTALPENNIPLIDNVYEFIDQTLVQIDVVYDTLPELHNRNKILVLIVDDKVEGIYSTVSSRKPKLIFDKDNILEGSLASLGLLTNGKALVDLLNLTIISKKNNRLYNLRHKYIFKLSSKKNLYLIDRDTRDNHLYIYLNSEKILYEQDFIESSIQYNKASNYYYFTRYPIQDVSIQVYGSYNPNLIGIYNYLEQIDPATSEILRIVYNNTSLSVTNTGKLLDPITNEPEEISVYGTVRGYISPIITYSRIGTRNEDGKYLQYDISSLNTNFTNGTICLSSNEISTSTVASNLDFLYPEGKNINWLSSLDVLIRLTNKDGYPIPNKIVEVEIDDSEYGNINDLVQISSTSADSKKHVSVRTSMNGDAVISLLNSNSSSHTYIQKQWVNNNKITIPYNIPVTNTGNIFLYMITADDPLLAQLEDRDIIGLEEISQLRPYDYYTRDNDISSYYLEGRKIAYVSLQANEEISNNEYNIVSRFIKPTSISQLDDNLDSDIKLAYMYNPLIERDDSFTFDTFEDTFDPLLARFTFAGNKNIVSGTLPSKFDQKWSIQDDEFVYADINTDNYTVIEYNYIPGIDDDNVIGYYIRYIPDTDTVKLKASFYDGNFNTTINSISEPLHIGSSYSSESHLVLSTESDAKNSYIGPYSYLTISDYLNSSAETNATKYICKYSSSVIRGSSFNRCSHPDPDTRDYYEPNDLSNAFCRHCMEYDITIPLNKRCPGLDEQLINPFILYSE